MQRVGRSPLASVLFIASLSKQSRWKQEGTTESRLLAVEGTAKAIGEECSAIAVVMLGRISHECSTDALPCVYEPLRLQQKNAGESLRQVLKLLQQVPEP